VATVADAAHQLQAVHQGHAAIGNQEIDGGTDGLGRFQGAQGHLAIFGNRHLEVADFLEQGDDHAPHRIAVVYNQKMYFGIHDSPRSKVETGPVCAGPGNRSVR